MRLFLTKLENIGLTIITILLLLSPLCLLLLVRLGGYIVNLCDFYFYKLIGFQSPTQPSVCESCRSLSFSFWSSIAPTLTYKSSL